VSVSRVGESIDGQDRFGNLFGDCVGPVVDFLNRSRTVKRGTKKLKTLASLVFDGSHSSELSNAELEHRDVLS